MGGNRTGEHGQAGENPVGDLLRSFRERRLWTQEKLSERSGLPVRTISSIETGDRKRPHLSTLEIFAEALELTADEWQRLVAARSGSTAGVVTRTTPVSETDKPEPYRLPEPATRFVGRQDLIAQALELIRQPHVRLLTLVGSGGIGKTRVALRLAEELRADFPDGVCFVDLAPLSDYRLVATATTQALAAPTPGHESAEEAAIAFCRDKVLLLLLDNMERLLEAGAFVDRLLGACPTVKMLVTSREHLGIAREQVLPVQPMSLLGPIPRGRNDGRPSMSTTTDAVDLFVSRALAVNPAYAPTIAEIEDIGAVCAHLDGIPLAIELAAARIAHFGTAGALFRHLDRRLPMLTGGPDRTDRHRTMRAAIDWSYVSLSPLDQAMLRRLSAFPGGCTLEAAIIVWRDAPWLDPDAAADTAGTPSPPSTPDQNVLTALFSLVDKSLLQPNPGHGIEPRYRMLDTIREYGQEQLEVSGEGDAIRYSLASFFLTLAERAESDLFGADQVSWMARLEAEQDNFRTSLGWMIEQGDAEAAMRLASALWAFWSASGRLREGRVWLAKAIAVPGSETTAARAKALLRLGNLSLDLAEYPAAREAYSASLEISDAQRDALNAARALTGKGLAAWSTGDFAEAKKIHLAALHAWTDLESPRGIALTWHNLGVVALGEGDLATARELFERSGTMRNELGDAGGVAWIHVRLGTLDRLEGDLPGSRQELETALAMFGVVGDRLGEGIALHELGCLERASGDIGSSLERYKAALNLRHDAGDIQGCIDCIEGVAATACVSGRFDVGIRLYAAAATWRKRQGAPALPPVFADDEQLLKEVRSNVVTSDYAVGWAAGEAMSFAQAIQLATSFTATDHQD